MKYRKEYKMNFPYGDKPHHTWSIIGAHGAKHLHISSYGKDDNVNFSGGLETHWRNPPEYMAEDAPSQDKCWLLGQPCWHDGTSSYVSDKIIPTIERELRGNGLDYRAHDRIFLLLESEMRETFEATTASEE